MWTARLVLAALVAAVPSPSHAQPVGPDPFVADTERVLGDFARDTRKRRLHGGVALLVLGGAAVTGGYLLAQTEDQGGFVDLSPLVRGFGYAFIGVGGLNLIAGTLFFFTTFEPERAHAELRTSIERGDGRAASLRARTTIADHAASERRSRDVMRGAGYVVLGASVVAVGVGFAVRGEDDREWPFFVGGLAGGLVGAGLLVGGSVEGPYGDLEREFRVATPTARLVPTRDGAVLAIGGQF